MQAKCTALRVAQLLIVMRAIVRCRVSRVYRIYICLPCEECTERMEIMKLDNKREANVIVLRIFLLNHFYGVPKVYYFSNLVLTVCTYRQIPEI